MLIQNGLKTYRPILRCKLQIW